MNRLKLFTTSTMVALVLAACGDGRYPTVPTGRLAPEGTISGSVTIEGAAAVGVTATLSSGMSAVVDSTGGFSFERVEVGTHTVAISGSPEDATFVQSTRSATISADGQNVHLSFVGEYVRSSAVVGRVSATGAAPNGGDASRTSLSGVTVTLIGERGTTETVQTEIDGGFAFAGLRAGAYAVAISGFPEDVSFDAEPKTVAVAVDEVGTVDFVGFVHATIVGRVVRPQDGEPESGVWIKAMRVGGSAMAVDSTTTDSAGGYALSVPFGDYRIEVSKRSRDFAYPEAGQHVSVGPGERMTFGDIHATANAAAQRKTITGKVIAPQGGGRGQAGVLLSATKVGGTLPVDTTTTDATGTFTLSVEESGEYRIEASKRRFGFDYPNGSQSVSVASSESSTAFGDIQANTWTILDLTAERGTDSATVVLRFFSMKRESGRNYGFPEGHGVDSLWALYRSEDGRFLPATFTFQDDDSRESAVVAVGHDGGAFPDDTFTIRVVVQSKRVVDKVSRVLDVAIETVVVPAKTDTPTQTITGKVIAPQGGGRGEAGVRVSATKVGDTVAAAATTTDATGTFALTVSDPGAYDIEASKERYGFDYPNGSQRVSVAAGESEAFGDVQSNTWQIVDLTAERASDATKVILRFFSVAPIAGRDYGLPEGTTGGVQYTSQYRDVGGGWKHVELDFHGNNDDAYLASVWQGGGQAGSVFPDDTFTIRIKVRARDGENATLDSVFTAALVPTKAKDPTQRQTITGKVIAPRGGGKGEAGVLVSATKVGDTVAADTATTGAAGTFTLTVTDPGEYDVEASKKRYGFDYPNGSRRVSVAAGADESFGEIQSNTWQIVDLTAERVSGAPKVILRFFSVAPIAGRDYGFPEGTKRGVQYTSQYRDASGQWKHVELDFHGDNDDAYLASVWQGGGQAGSVFPDDTFTIRIKVRARDIQDRTLDTVSTETLVPAKAEGTGRRQTVGGRVIAPQGGKGEPGVLVALTQAGISTPTDTATTNASGAFTLTAKEPGLYEVHASKKRYGFDYPDGDRRVQVAAGADESFGEIQSNTWQILDMTAERTSDTTKVLMRFFSLTTQAGRDYGVPSGNVGLINYRSQYRDKDGTWKYVVPAFHGDNREAMLAYVWQGGGQAGSRFPDDTFTIRIQATSTDGGGATVDSAITAALVPARPGRPRQRQTIVGRVIAPQGGGKGEAGVLVSATKVGAGTATDTATTDATGAFTLVVGDPGEYDVEARKDQYGFDYPNGSRRVSVAAGENKAFGDVQANTWRILDLTGARATDSTKIVMRFFSVRRRSGRDYGLPSGNVGAVVYSSKYRDADGTWRNVDLENHGDGRDAFLGAVGRGGRRAGRTFPADTFTVRIVAKSTNRRGGRGATLDSAIATAVVPAKASGMAQRSAVSVSPPVADPVGSNATASFSDGVARAAPELGTASGRPARVARREEGDAGVDGVRDRNRMGLGRGAGGGDRDGRARDRARAG